MAVERSKQPHAPSGPTMSGVRKLIPLSEIQRLNGTRASLKDPTAPLGISEATLREGMRNEGVGTKRQRVLAYGEELRMFARDSNNRTMLEEEFVPQLSPRQRQLAQRRFFYPEGEKLPTQTLLAGELKVGQSQIHQIEARVLWKLDRYRKKEPLKKNSKLTNINEVTALRILLAMGQSEKDIARHFGINKNTLRSKMRESGSKTNIEQLLDHVRNPANRTRFSNEFGSLLPSMQYLVFKMRFLYPEGTKRPTQEEVARELEITREKVIRAEREALRKIDPRVLALARLGKSTIEISEILCRKRSTIRRIRKIIGVGLSRGRPRKDERAVS